MEEDATLLEAKQDSLSVQHNAIGSSRGVGEQVRRGNRAAHNSSTKSPNWYFKVFLATIAIGLAIALFSRSSTSQSSTEIEQEEDANPDIEEQPDDDDTGKASFPAFTPSPSSQDLLADDPENFHANDSEPTETYPSDDSNGDIPVLDLDPFGPSDIEDLNSTDNPAESPFPELSAFYGNLNALSWNNAYDHLDFFEQRGNALKQNKSFPAIWAEVLRSDCGFGYEEAKNKGREWRVTLAGHNWGRRTLELAGCQLGRRVCSLWPRCRFDVVTQIVPGSLNTTNVLVFHASDHGLLNPETKPDHTVNVLYWREAYWQNLPSLDQQKQFDLEMGVHAYAGYVNPNFRVKAGHLLQGLFPGTAQPNFAASLISDCHTYSHRQSLIDRLVVYLGSDRVHQYGKCGNRRIPGTTIRNALKILAGYKLQVRSPVFPEIQIQS